MRKIRKNLPFLVMIFLIICCGIRLKILYTSYKTYRFYKNEIARFEKENKLLLEKIEKIKNDPFYIEKLLREEWGMMKEGELAIKIGE
ncbi:MAG: septum formation initiator family protein [Candidatus Omnitrophica bacterium]|nr:septum formation initiator family protein [Candidatus Omnitrophota bacterium]MCM8802711.1 septum formation initiator family protein [Candidatus Omnitrophota bacterium]